MRIFRIAIVSASMVGTVVHAQSPAQQTFRAGVDYVEIDAVVTDRQGNFIRNLTKADFQVLEDGKPQTVSVFSLVNIPTNRDTEDDDAPGSSEGASTRGRLYVMVLDDLHTPPLRTPQVTRAARLFVQEHMAANDLAAVVTTSGRSNAAQELTGDKQLLLRAIDGFSGQRLWRAGESLDAERGFNARIAMSSLREVSARMGELHGRRKAMLFISEGIDFDIYDVFANRDANTVREEVRAAISAATRSNVSIYSVDPRGLSSLADEEIERGESSLSTGRGSSSERLRLAQDSLRILSDMTGGFAAVNSNDFAGIFDRIVRDNSTYYLLGFNPANDKRDGRFRKLDVRVARDGVMVRARRGYALPREERRR